MDRATCTDNFLDLFPETSVEHIITEESDHQALVVRALEMAPRTQRGGERPFRYEEAWTRHEQYESMVAEAWEAAGSGGQNLDDVWKKLSMVTGCMQWWAREVFGSIR